MSNVPIKKKKLLIDDLIQPKSTNLLRHNFFFFSTGFEHNEARKRRGERVLNLRLLLRENQMRHIGDSDGRQVLGEAPVRPHPAKPHSRAVRRAVPDGRPADSDTSRDDCPRRGRRQLVSRVDENDGDRRGNIRREERVEAPFVVGSN